MVVQHASSMSVIVFENLHMQVLSLEKSRHTDDNYGSLTNTNVNHKSRKGGFVQKAIKLVM